jgi:hypothetical protein
VKVGEIFNPDAMTLGQITKTLEGFKGVLEKANAEAGVTDMQLVREDLSAQLALNAPVDTPIRNRLSRTKGNGRAHAWYRLNANAHTDGSLFMGTAPTGGAFSGDAGGLPTSTNEAYVYVSAPYKELGDIASVTIKDQASGASLRDLAAWRQKVKMLNVALMEEWMIVNGNVTTAPLTFDGASALFTENNVDRGGQQLSIGCIAEVHNRIVDRGGQPRFNVMSTRQKRKFNDLVLVTYFGVRQTQGQAAYGALASGLNVAKWDFGYGETDIVSSRFVRPNGGSSAGPEEILVFDHVSMDDNGNVVEMVDLIPVSSYPLARTGSTVTRDLIMESTLLKVSNQFFQGKVTNVGAPVYAA